MIENTNKAIKTIKRNSNGFSNWDRFRNRVLYAINDDVTYSIYPLTWKMVQLISQTIFTIKICGVTFTPSYCIGFTEANPKLSYKAKRSYRSIY